MVRHAMQAWGHCEPQDFVNRDHSATVDLSKEKKTEKKRNKPII
jgi:hypothetical protein